MEPPPKKTVEELLEELLATYKEGIRMMKEIETLSGGHHDDRDGKEE